MNLEYTYVVRERITAPAFEGGPSLDAAAAEAPEPAAPATKKAKRIYDAVLAALGLVLLSPIFLLVATIIKLADGGPVFYRQKRIGHHGIPFFILKFRTMVPGADKAGLPITRNGDHRVTRVGRFLRKTKLDELPQLWNVLRGEMSLVGPRPEVAHYVNHYTPEQRAILEHKPGITDLASIRFRNEETLLQSTGPAMELFYIQQCLPRKIELNQDYARTANLLTDTWIILQTICPYWAGVLGLYAIILASSFWASYELVGNFTLSGSARDQFARQLPLIVGLQLICLLARRQCKGLLCYFGLSELWQASVGLFEAALILLGFSLLAGDALPPRNVILTNLCTSLLFLSGFRVVLRLWRERTEGEHLPGSQPMRVGIIGAGSLGAQLADFLKSQKSLGRVPVAFFDDDFAKWHKQIHQIPVVGMPECILQGWSEKLDEVAIALPNASEERLVQIHRLFEKTKLKLYTLQWPLPAWHQAELWRRAVEL